jgi:hypothetical protein
MISAVTATYMVGKQRRLEVPLREAPRHVHGERARRDHQEDRRPDDRRGAPHDISLASAGVAVNVDRALAAGDVLREVLVELEPMVEGA